jgi:hypothetical protein
LGEQYVHKSWPINKSQHINQNQSSNTTQQIASTNSFNGTKSLKNTSDHRNAEASPGSPEPGITCQQNYSANNNYSADPAKNQQVVRTAGGCSQWRQANSSDQFSTVISVNSLRAKRHWTKQQRFGFADGHGGGH